MEHECMGPKLTQAESFVLGVGAKMFTIAGPVILYGTVASAIYGVILWVSQQL
ncbi:MAG: SpoVA/SpoVAEb family sporulation membrane protein [Clostridia bacterium]|nr:SpoVA/SpoVAEb family sporulation membrane protein [Clostridia bacterium]